MHSLQTNLLINNFVESAHAVRYSSSEPLPLIANWQGTRLYDSRYGQGRAWSSFYRFWSLLTCQNASTTKLKQAILHTHALYLRCLPEIAPHLQAYKTYLIQASKGYKVDEKELLPSRHILARWCVQTKPFIKLAVETPDPRLARLLHDCQQQEKLFSSPLLEQLAPCRKILKLEGQVKGPLPLALFRKAVKGKPLDAIETGQLEKWIKKVNKRAIPVRSLSQAIEALALLNQKKEVRQDLLRLQLLLEDHGCKLFQQPDKHSLAWQQSLKQGVQIQHEGTVFTLAAEIPSRRPENDQCRVFTLLEEPEKVIVAANNPFLLRLRSCRSASPAVCGIEPARYESIASNGLTALMERLQPLNAAPWHANPPEEALIKQVIALLSRFAAENFTPQHFNDSTLLFDKQFHLRSLKPMRKGRFDFDALEQFIFHLSAGRLPTFQRIMQASKLSTHPIAKFYHEAAAQAFRSDANTIEDLAGIYKIAHARVVDRAAGLAKQLLEISQQLFLKYMSTHPGSKPEVIKKAVQKAVLELYRATCAGGLILFAASEIDEGKIFDKIERA